MAESKRIFLGVQLPQELKAEIAEKFLDKIPKDKWRKVLPENLHITLKFLGYLPREKLEGLRETLGELEKFPQFEAELKGAGHFKGRVLWIGVGKGSEEFNALSSRLNNLLDLNDERFHPHVTLGRNKGMGKQETDELIEKLREEKFEAKIFVRGFDIIESKLQKAGPKYSTVATISFAQL